MRHLRPLLFWIGAFVPLISQFEARTTIPLTLCMLAIALSGEYKLAGLHYLLLAKLNMYTITTPLALWYWTGGMDDGTRVFMYALSGVYLITAYLTRTKVQRQC